MRTLINIHQNTHPKDDDKHALFALWLDGKITVHGAVSYLNSTCIDSKYIDHTDFKIQALEEDRKQRGLPAINMRDYLPPNGLLAPCGIFWIDKLLEK